MYIEKNLELGYLLVVGFICNVYRKEPKVRLFLNEKLIDEFNIKNRSEKIDSDNKKNNLLKNFLKQNM